MAFFADSIRFHFGNESRRAFAYCGDIVLGDGWKVPRRAHPYKYPYGMWSVGVIGGAGDCRVGVVEFRQAEQTTDSYCITD